MGDEICKIVAYNAWLKKQPAEMVVWFIRNSLVLLKYLKKHYPSVYKLKRELYRMDVFFEIEYQKSEDGLKAYQKELKTVYKKIGKAPSQLNAGINALGFLIKDVRNSRDPVALNGLGTPWPMFRRG